MNNLKATPGNEVYEFCSAKHFVKMRDDAKEHRGELAEIVGIRVVKNPICDKKVRPLCHTFN